MLSTNETWLKAKKWKSGSKKERGRQIEREIDRDNGFVWEVYLYISESLFNLFFLWIIFFIIFCHTFSAKLQVLILKVVIFLLLEEDINRRIFSKWQQRFFETFIIFFFDVTPTTHLKQKRFETILTLTQWKKRISNLKI